MMAASNGTGQELATTLSKSTISGGSDAIQIFQLVHRLNILAKWFNNDLDKAKAALQGRCVLELGCGQGDMTVALAHLVQNQLHDEDSEHHDNVAKGKILALDPGDLDYGAPYTLRQAQKHISDSASGLGKCINWIQYDPIEYLENLDTQNEGTSTADGLPDFIILAHSIFYLPNEDYFSRLLRALHNAAAQSQTQNKNGDPPRLLLAEWGLRVTNPAAEAHVLAVEIQKARPIEEGNVQCVISPARIVELAKEAGWRIEREAWIECPQVDDGKWEVGAVKADTKLDGLHEDSEIKRKYQRMLELSEKEGEVRSMDVWTGVFGLE
ncbi:hypothetical protein CB0940_10821 [Cercospora beticola]|uniref:Methyltransferase domain-containing protein n=1 Tax=Cercospora beticola TaxID=122368 RepID=A0A2G5HU50_CERBT|nr:hypothetical protein CB0940_10821 [Cercospora beticola]PIA96055.1 hypothetical protein CB0940_10821 [Cercospora beticola]WPB07552.1 hypothetical protein RHO25_012213 [Cercospora beticola]